MAATLEDRVKAQREKIEAAKITKAQAEGSADEIKRGLKKESNIANSKQGRAKIEKLDSEITTLTNELEELLTQMEEEENAEQIS